MTIEHPLEMGTMISARVPSESNHEQLVTGKIEDIRMNDGHKGRCIYVLDNGERVSSAYVVAFAQPA